MSSVSLYEEWLLITKMSTFATNIHTFAMIAPPQLNRLLNFFTTSLFYAVDHEMSGVTFSDVVLKNKANVQQQLNEFVYSIGGNPEDMGADNFILASENQMSQGLTSSESIVFAVVFILMFVVCGYLLIYNIFDISVMQDVRQYGLLRTIGTSTRQIKGIVNRQAVWLTLIGLPIGLIAGFFAGWVLLPIVTEIINLEYSMVGTSVSTSPLIFVIAALFTILTVFISTRKPAKKAAKISPLEAHGIVHLSFSIINGIHLFVKFFSQLFFIYYRTFLS